MSPSIAFTLRSSLRSVTAPAVIGEVMSLHLMTESSSVAFRVQVLESRPVVVNGSVRHEIRLGIESVSLMPTGGGLPEAV